MPSLNIGRHSSRGMTLVETLVVMAIFMVVMMAVMSLFIPAVKSTAVQTQVTDVQSNLRLAMNRMSMDLLTAGFLIGQEEPIINETSEGFTIQTRAVGDGFARIVNSVNNSGTTDLTLSQEAMVDNFPNNSKVRLFESISGEEVAGGGIYTATPNGSNSLSLDAGIDVPDESVVVRVRDSSPALQTIRYQLNDTDGDGNGDTLVRIVNGDMQLLARNVTNVAFLYNTATTGRINKIDISLTGETKAVGTDVVSQAKTRQLQSTVTLRNVF